MRLSGFHRQNDLLVVVHDNGVTVVGELLVQLRVEGDVFTVRLLAGLIVFFVLGAARPQCQGNWLIYRCCCRVFVDCQF